MKLKFFTAVAAISLLVAAEAASAAIVVTNAGFEDPVVSGYNLGPITGWSQVNPGNAVGVSGVWNPSAFGGTGLTAHSGSQAGFAGNAPDGSFIYQNVGALTAGNTYVLSVWVAQRLDYPLGSYEVALGTVSGSTFTAYASASAPIPAAGSWIQTGVTWTNSGNLTSDLYVILVGGIGASQAQTSFDDVSVSTTADADGNVPEPASMAIWGLGAVGCAVAGYRRRKLA